MDIGKCLFYIHTPGWKIYACRCAQIASHPPNHPHLDNALSDVMHLEVWSVTELVSYGEEDKSGHSSSWRKKSLFVTIDLSVSVIPDALPLSFLSLFSFFFSPLMECIIGSQPPLPWKKRNTYGASALGIGLGVLWDYPFTGIIVIVFWGSVTLFVSLYLLLHSQHMMSIQFG